MDKRDWPGQVLQLAAQFTWDLARPMAVAWRRPGVQCPIVGQTRCRPADMPGLPSRDATRVTRSLAGAGASKGGCGYPGSLHREGPEHPRLGASRLRTRSRVAAAMRQNDDFVAGTTLARHESWQRIAALPRCLVPCTRKGLDGPRASVE